MDITIDADNVEINTGYYGGKDLKVELRNVEASDILESIFEELWDNEKVSLVLKHITISEFAENLEGNDRDELYRILREDFE